MEYDIRLEPVVSLPLAVVRRRASRNELSKVVPDACGLVWGVLKVLQVSNQGRHVAIYWDREINLEVGVEVNTPFGGHGEVVGSATPAGTVVTTTHFGPYERLLDAHQAILAWCNQRGCQPIGPNWEIYGHWVAEWNTDPTQIRTDVFYLIETDSR